MVERSQSFGNGAIFSLSRGLQVFTTSVTLTSGALVGAQIATTKAWATLPTTALILAMGLVTIPVSLALSRYGSRLSFSTGALLGALGAAVAAWGGSQRSFTIFCLGFVLLGGYQALAQYYHYAASDSVTEDRRSWAVSMVLAGGVLGAAFGSAIAFLDLEWLGIDVLLQPFVLITALLLANALLFTRLKKNRLQTSSSAPVISSVKGLMANTRLRSAIVLSAGSYFVMSLLMTAAPLAIVSHGHHHSTAALGVQWHLVSMFAPSLLTAYLQKRWGLKTVALLGCVLFLGSVLFLQGHSSASSMAGLILLGLGWNFIFLTGAVEVIASTSTHDQAKARAMNEFMGLAASTFVSALAGVLFATWGWASLLATGLAGIAVLGAFAFRLKT